MQLTAQKQELKKLSMELNKLIEVQGKKHEKAVKHYQRRIWEMEHSLSWKITKPLRWVKKLLKKKINFNKNRI